MRSEGWLTSCQCLGYRLTESGPIRWEPSYLLGAQGPKGGGPSTCAPPGVRGWHRRVFLLGLAVLRGCSPLAQWPGTRRRCAPARLSLLMPVNVRIATARGFLLFSPISLWPHGLQQSRLPYPSVSPGVCSNSCPLSRWCHPTISSSAIPFSSCL